MSQNTITDLSLDSLATVTGGAPCGHRSCPPSNVAQNGGTGYFDHSYGFGNVVRGGRYDYAAPNGFAGRAGSVHGQKLTIQSSDNLPL